MYDHGLIYLYLCDEVGRAGVQRELPFCPDHVVVGQPHYDGGMYSGASSSN